MACGFLKAGELSVKGQTMLDRTNHKGTKPIDDEEWAHLYEHRADFDNYPKLARFKLITNRRNHVSPRGLSCFYRDSREWCAYLGVVGFRWYGYLLVLRRCM